MSLDYAEFCRTVGASNCSENYDSKTYCSTATFTPCQIKVPFLYGSCRNSTGTVSAQNLEVKGYTSNCAMTTFINIADWRTQSSFTPICY